jgi:hypothetical protein
MFRTININPTDNTLSGKYRAEEICIVSVDRASSYALYLPDATSCTDTTFLLFPNSSSGTVTLTPKLNQTIDGESTKSLTAAMLIVSDGSNWLVHDGSGSGTTTETDPIVGAVNGIVKANGAGSISAAVAGTDYVLTESDPIFSAAIAALTATKFVITDASNDLASFAGIQIIELDHLDPSLTGKYTNLGTVLVLCDATTSGFTVTLPDASTGNVMFVFVKTDSSANVVTINR